MEDSKKITIAGVLGFLGILSTQLAYVFDADPGTNLDFGLIAAALSLLGIGWFAIGNDKNAKK